MKIFLLLIILNYSIFATESLDANKNLREISKEQKAESNKKDDNLNKLISEEVKSQMKENEKTLKEFISKEVKVKIKKNEEENLTLVYNIDQIYKNANDFYNSAFIHLLWIISFIGLVLGFFKWRENLKIKEIEKGLQESKEELDEKILLVENEYIKKLEAKKDELLKEVSKKIAKNIQITNNNIATNEFIRDIYDFDKEEKKERKEAILDKLESILETNYKNIDWLLKLEFFKRQITYYKENKNEIKVLQILEEIFRKYGFNENTYRIKADYYFLYDQLLLAKENYLKISLAESNEKVYFYLRLGEIEERLGNLIEAKNYYELILKEEGNNAYYLSLLGKIQEKLEDFGKAEEYYKKAIDNSSNSSYYLSLLGKLKEKMKDLNEAKDCYKKAIQISSNDEYYISLLGNLEEKLGNIEEARNLYKKAIQNVSDNPYYIGLLSKIEEKLGNFEEARNLYKRAVQISPNDAYYISLLGTSEERYGNLEQAKELYKRAIQISPNDAYYISLLGRLEEKSRNLEEARNLYKRAIQISPNDAYCISLLGRLEEKLGNFEVAEKSYEKAVQISPNDEYYLSLLGRLEEKLGNFEQAENCYKKAIQISPNDGYYFNLLGGLKERLGNLKQARTLYKKATQISPENEYYLSLLGKLEERLGNFEQAKEAYKKIINENPSNIEHLKLLAKLEEKQGNISETIQIYKKIIMISPNEKLINCEEVFKIITSVPNKNEVEKILFSSYESNNEKRINLLLRLVITQLKQKTIKQSYLKRVLNRFKNDKQTLIELSNYFLNKNTDIACESLKKYLEIEKENIDVNIFNNLGVLEERKGNEVEAVKFYIKAIEKDPNFILGFYNKGHLYMQLKNYDDALIDLNKALKINKKNNKFEIKLFEETLVLLGEIHSIRKNYLNLVLVSEELYNLNKEYNISEKSEVNYNKILEEVKKDISNKSENNLNIKFLKIVEKNIEKIINLK